VLFFLNHPELNGIYNAGSGVARTFNDLVNATFAAMELQPNIIYIDMPGELRDRYQYNTEADMTKLRNAGYKKPFQSLEDGVRDYVQTYLSKGCVHW